MKQSALIAFLAGVGITGAAAFIVGAGPGHDDHAHADTHEPAGHGGMSEEEMMAAWMEMATPGEHHAEMAKAVGNWSAETSFIMAPGAPPVEGTGTATSTWVLGGRFIKSEFHMDDMMGMPFDGIGYYGYDNARKEYVSIWMDSFATGIMQLSGQMNDGKVELSGTTMAPEGEKKMKIVTEWQDDNHFSDTFYDVQPDGTLMMSGRISYSRR